MKIDREAVANTYLSGQGIEIGALHMPLKVPRSAQVKYVDRMNVADLRKQYPELNDKNLVNVDIIADGEKLDSIANGSQDFVIANHFLEHCQNPIDALIHMFRVLKVGGVLYLTIPDKRCSFDVKRPITPFEHIWRDYLEGPEWSKRQHFEEWVKFVNEVQDAAEIKRQTEQLIQMDYSIHFHVWTPVEMLELIQGLRKIVAFELEMSIRSDVEVIFLLRKSPEPVYVEPEIPEEDLRLVEFAGNLPVPPIPLIYRVHGFKDVQNFLQVGQTCKKDLATALSTIGRDFASFDDILDFGCGSGLVIRWFQEEAKASRLYGTDYDSESITWCRINLPFAEFSTNNSLPPMDYPADRFDLIFAISVFTHLREDCQFLWLEELQRITKPGGIVIVTTMGEFCINQAAPEYIELINNLGFFFTPMADDMKDLFPEWYGGAYITQNYINEQYTKYFKVLGYLPQGLNNHQDIILLQKPA